MPKIQTKLPFIKAKKVLSRLEKNKAYQKEYQKKYREKNKAYQNAYQKKYREKNREKLKEKNKKYYQENKDKKKEYYIKNKEKLKEKRKKNKEKLKERKKKYYEENREKINEKKRKFYQKNKGKITQQQNKYKKKKYHTDKNYRLTCLLRARFRKALKAQRATKNSSVLKLSGLNVDDLKKWIESQFQEGMTWENIHIDHMMPCASFDLTDEKNHAICFHYTNLKPEFATDNITFGAKIKHDMKWVGDQWYIKSSNGLYKPRSMNDISAELEKIS